MRLTASLCIGMALAALFLPPAAAALPRFPQWTGSTRIDLTPLFPQLRDRGLSTATIEALHSKIAVYETKEVFAAYDPWSRNLFLGADFLEPRTHRLRSKLSASQLSILVHEFDHVEKDFAKDPFAYDGIDTLEPITGIPVTCCVVATGVGTAGLGLAKAGFRYIHPLSGALPRTAAVVRAASVLRTPLALLPIIAGAVAANSIWTRHVEGKFRPYLPESTAERMVVSTLRGIVGGLTVGGLAKLTARMVPTLQAGTLLRTLSSGRGMLAVGAAITAWNLARAAAFALRDRNSETEASRKASESIFRDFLEKSREGKRGDGPKDPRLCSDEVSGQLVQQGVFRLIQVIDDIEAYNSREPSGEEAQGKDLRPERPLELPPMWKNTAFWCPESDHNTIYQETEIPFDYRGHHATFKSLWGSSLGMKPPMTSQELLDRINRGDSEAFRRIRARVTSLRKSFSKDTEKEEGEWADLKNAQSSVQ